MANWMNDVSSDDFEDYDQPDEDGYHWMYGHFTGTDPRDFRPDMELCTDDEIANWKADCEAWDRGEGKPAPPPGTTLYDAEGNWIGHILAPRYGIGTYRYRDDDESAK